MEIKMCYGYVFRQASFIVVLYDGIKEACKRRMKKGET